MDVIDWIVRILAALGLPSAVIYFVRDRRRDRAETRVLERTVDPRISQEHTSAGKAGIEMLEAQILAMGSAFDQERASKDRRIAELEERDELRQREIRRLVEAAGEREAVVAALRDHVAQVEEQVAQLRVRLENLPPATPETPGPFNTLYGDD